MRVFADQRKTFDNRLRYENPIEWVFVDLRQSCERHNVDGPDWEGLYTRQNDVFVPPRNRIGQQRVFFLRFQQ